MKKDKKNSEEMSDKKRLQNLVWDGLFNGLDPKATEGAKAEKKEKKTAKEKDKKDKSDENVND